MSELRYDPLQRRWVIIATERQKRPGDFSQPTQIARNKRDCPFCPGAESSTPPEIYALRPADTPPDSPGWTLRVIPNRFPALSGDDGGIEWHDEADLYKTLPGVGAHEVVIEGTDHDAGPSELSLALIEDILNIYKKRLRELSENRRLKYTLIFKNHGSIAGASLSHPHSQIISTPVTPRTVAIELISSKKYFAKHKKCLVCELIKSETSDNRRVVYDDGNFICFTTFAPRFPFELFLAPINHKHDFAALDKDDTRALAKCMKEILYRLKVCLTDPPLNYLIHTSPNLSAEPTPAGYWDTIAEDYHWHIEIMPRLTRTAGFEWGSGLHINPMLPENAAVFLKAVEMASLK